jgi:hypothetical protein
MDPGWWSTDWRWTDEMDFFEEWGWNCSPNPSCLTGVTWIYSTNPYHLVQGMKSLYSMFDPSAGFHRYVTVVNANNSIEEYIDGVRQSWLGSNGVLGPPPSVTRASMGLILTNAVRENSWSGPDPAPNFRSGSRTFTIRSIAVYEDGNHAGQDLSGGGIAPGTTIG